MVHTQEIGLTLCDIPGQEFKYNAFSFSRDLAMTHLPRQRPISPNRCEIWTPHKPQGPPAAALAAGSSLGKRTGLTKQYGLRHAVQFCCSSGRSKALTPASFLRVLLQSREYALMPLSYLLVDLLTWFLGSLNIWVIKCCFSPSTKPKVYETPQIIIHFFFSPTQPSCLPGVPLLASMVSMRD